MYMIAEVSQYVAVSPCASGGEGLKLPNMHIPDSQWFCRLFAEAWIEISKYYHPKIGDIGRLLRGGVD